MLIFNAHFLQMGLHLGKYQACRVYLWLKCTLLGFILDHAYLCQIFVLPLQVVLLSVPKLSKLCIYGTCWGVFWRCDLICCACCPVLWSVAPVLGPSGRWTSASLPHLGSFLFFQPGLLVNRLSVEPLVPTDVLFFLLAFWYYLETFTANAWLKLVRLLSRRWLLSRCNLPLELLYRLDIVRIFVIFRDRCRWHLCLLQNFLTMSARFWLKLAFSLNLALDLSLFGIYEVLFALQMLGDTFFPGLEPFAHLFGLATHWFRLECAAWSLL